MISHMKRSIFIAALLPLFLVACEGGGDLPEDSKEQYVKAQKESSFTTPHIKDDFCGVHIKFQYCKCAFHNDYCEAVGMDKKSANVHVQSKYDEYVLDLREKFTEGCVAQNGYVKKDSCYVCPMAAEVEGEQCLIPEEDPCTYMDCVYGCTDGECEAEPEPELEACDLENDWEKYSDFDFRIPEAERSFEAKEYARTQTDIVNTYAEQAELVYETELLRIQLADVKDYKAALVDNLRDNLVKATLRLTYTTYSQIDGAKGAGESFSKFLTSTESLEVLGAGMKSMQAVMPSDSRLAIDTNTAGGKVKSIGWNATLEAIESMGDPKAIAQQVMKDSKGALVPSADITPEEVEILRVQNLENNLLNEVIAELEAEINENEAWLGVADVRIADLEAEALKWSAEEKARVLLVMEGECEN